MALTDNLISFWELEEASGTRVDAVTASGNDLTDNNTVTQATGKVGQAAQFTAANSESLSRASNSSLQTGDIDQTFCAWFYLDSKPANLMQGIVKTNSTTGAGYNLAWLNTTDRFRFALWQVGGALAAEVSATTFGAPSLATWYSIVGWFDSVGNTISISVNDGTTDSAAQVGTPGNDAVGFRLGALDDPTNFWNGRIDQVGFWKRVLTAEERTFLYNGGAGRSYAEILTGSGGGVRVGVAA